jgi:hypothetical protein
MMEFQRSRYDVNTTELENAVYRFRTGYVASASRFASMSMCRSVCICHCDVAHGVVVRYRPRFRPRMLMLTSMQSGAR